MRPLLRSYPTDPKQVFPKYLPVSPGSVLQGHVSLTFRGEWGVGIPASPHSPVLMSTLVGERRELGHPWVSCVSVTSEYSGDGGNKVETGVVGSGRRRSFTPPSRPRGHRPGGTFLPSGWDLCTYSIPYPARVTT